MCYQLFVVKVLIVNVVKLDHNIYLLKQMLQIKKKLGVSMCCFCVQNALKLTYGHL
jgi:hypothetical protein